MLLLIRPAGPGLAAIPDSTGYMLIGPGAAEMILIGGCVLSPGQYGRDHRTA